MEQCKSPDKCPTGVIAAQVLDEYHRTREELKATREALAGAKEDFSGLRETIAEQTATMGHMIEANRMGEARNTKEHDVLFGRTKELATRAQETELDMAARPTDEDLEKVETKAEDAAKVAAKKMSVGDLGRYVTWTFGIISSVIGLVFVAVKLTEG
ncbi:MAG: hypothetical protein KAR06_11755 [Deltaproteobacteria bacterium]|nr:hypothetical protein [Deltaproteobacteria bacterium]